MLGALCQRGKTAMGINIKQKGRNLWFIDVRARKDGKRLRQRETFTGTKLQAEERYLSIRAELLDEQARQGSLTLPRTPVRTFGEMLKLYLEKRGKISRYQRYRYDKLYEELGDVPLDQFGERFEAYLKILRKYPSKRTGKLLTDATINRQVEIARAVMNLAVDLEIIDRNPITKARFPKYKETPRDVVLSQEQIDRLVEVVKSEATHLQAALMFALQVPCRRSEIVNMRRADLDLINNAIRVRNGTTKNDAGCWKPIPPDMVAYFRNLPKESEYLFYRYEKKTDRYLPLGDFKKAWRTCLEKASIEDFRFHDTRHIAATALLDNGTPERIVQEVAGWKTDMRRTYYHRSGKTSLNLVRFANRVHSGYTSGQAEASTL